ncbi:AP-5 complex subunit beta-1-like isoform X1 [Glandiceps talaboti]
MAAAMQQQLQQQQQQQQQQQHSQWLEDITSFNRGPQSFLTKKGSDEEGFVVDILQALFCENIRELVKLQLLNILQENSQVLLTDNTSVEQTIGSLKNIFDETESESIYKNHILVTITTILIQHEQLEQQTKIFIEFMDFLLNMISKINDGFNRNLRRIACECLKEIEMTYPGILTRKLEHVYAMSQLENTFIAQSYTSLFVTVLKNSVGNMTQYSNDPPDNVLNELMCTRKEPLKPLILPDNFTSELFNVKKKAQRKVLKQKLASNVDTKELKRALSFVMESSTLMTTQCLYYIMVQLIECVAYVHDLSPATFKSLFLHCVSTADLSVFHLVFLLKERFSSQLFTDRDEEFILRRLLIYAITPTFKPSHQLLCYEWLLHFPEHQKDAFSERSLPTKLDSSYFATFFPRVFDDIDTTLAKLNVLSLCFKPSSISDSAAATLMSCLVSLHKSVNYGVTGLVAVALYRALFNYYRKHQYTTLVEDIYKCILGIIVGHPKFAAQTIDFLESIREFHPDSSFSVDVLRALTDQSICTPISAILEDLGHYLLILERAAEEKEITQNSVLIFLQQLLVSSDLCSNDGWSLGNSLLSVCRNVLKYHNTDLVFRELGDLLFLLLTKYDDIDIRERARFYYALMTNLSTQKFCLQLTSILTAFSPAAMATSQTLTSLVTGSANFSTACPVRQLDGTILQLRRAEKKWNIMKIGIPDSVDRGQMLEEYLKIIKSSDFNPPVAVAYYIYFKENMDILYEKVYAIVLHLQTSSNYLQVKDQEIAVIHHSNLAEPSCKQVTFEFCPLEPVPATFDISAMFSNEDGQTCSMPLAPLQISFEDLFLPLPEICGCSKQQVFNNIWIFIHTQQENSESSCTESVCSLQLSQDMISVTVTQKMAPFIVSSSSVGDIYQIGILLPPSSHLLMKIMPLSETAVISMVTDNWKILPLVNRYLHQLERSHQL